MQETSGHEGSFDPIGDVRHPWSVFGSEYWTYHYKCRGRQKYLVTIGNKSIVWDQESYDLAQEEEERLAESLAKKKWEEQIKKQSGSSDDDWEDRLNTWRKN